jgi:hypothetical protein
LDLLSSENFGALTQLYSQQCAADILQTKPHETKAREQIYASFQGFEGFLVLVKKFADAAQAPLPEPVLVDTTDDPRVHDIYDGTN